MSTELLTKGVHYDTSQLIGWWPVDAVIRDGIPGICWLDMRNVTLSEPFFFQTVERVKQERPYLEPRFTEYDALLRFEKAVPYLTPSGFVFHSSRCGSTVVSNALKVLKNVRVFSEPLVPDKLIGRFFTDVGDDKRHELIYSLLLRAAVNALGQLRSGDDRACFIKFSSVSVCQLARIRRIWPQVQTVFLYRDPIETVISNLDDPPVWMDKDGNRRIASALSGVDDQEIGSLSREEYCARVVGRFYSTALTAAGWLRLFNYAELTHESVLDILVGFFGLKVSSSERKAIAETMRYTAKDPTGTRQFEPDGDRKRQSASKLVVEMAEQWAYAPYTKLEQQRQSQTG